MSRLDLPNVNGINGSVEDKILCLLFLEKALTKNDIKNELSVSYGKIFNVVVRMENKGLIVARKFENGEFYYLTSEGCYEVQYRLNIDTYLDIYEFFLGLEYNTHNVISFLKNRFYRYYLEGVWEGNTLEEQYLSWCENNQLDPRKTGRKLKR